MGMMPFHVVFREAAEIETRTLTPLNQVGLPNRTFLLMELYCNEPQCDCRRVMINVIETERRQHVATINHAFECPAPPYDDDGQTFLDPLNPQSVMSTALLGLFEDMIATDGEYRQRLERHYAMWKSVVDDPHHPDHPKVRGGQQNELQGERVYPRQEPFRHELPKVGANDPCPCGSGRKHKRYCRT